MVSYDRGDSILWNKHKHRKSKKQQCSWLQISSSILYLHFMPFCTFLQSITFTIYYFSYVCIIFIIRKHTIEHLRSKLKDVSTGKIILVKCHIRKAQTSNRQFKVKSTLKANKHGEMFNFISQ